MRPLPAPLWLFLIRLLEWLLGLYYGGPEPPPALWRMLEHRPRRPLTDEELRALARLAYRSGHLHGFEWAERDLPRWRALDPDGAAAALVRAGLVDAGAFAERLSPDGSPAPRSPRPRRDGPPLDRQ